MYRLIIFLYLITAVSLTRFLLVPYAYAFLSNQLIAFFYYHLDLKQIYLFYSVKALHLSLLNVCCIFNIDLFFLMNCLWPFLKTILVSLIFFQDNLFHFQLLLESSYDFKVTFSFYYTFFVLFHLQYHHLLSKYKFLLLAQKMLSLFFQLIHLLLIQIVFNFFSFIQWSISFLIWSIKSCFNIFCNVFIIIIWFLCIEWIHVPKFCFFTIY